MAGINLFLCTCFDEITRVVNYDALLSRLSGDARIASVTMDACLCLKGRAGELVSSVDRNARILVGACSLLGRGNQLLNDLEEAGAARFRTELVDLRESCAWIHGHRAAAATAKAADLLEIGLHALENKESSRDVTVTVADDVLVIGAGPAGMAAADALARGGIRVILLERGAEPGGMLGLVSRGYPDDSNPAVTIAAFRERMSANPNIALYPRSKILSARGYAGAFSVHFTSDAGEQRVTVGAVILAAGGRILLPAGLYRYGELKQVVSQMELETRFKKGSLEVQNVLFIQCVGARCEERPYCSTICCPASIKNAMRIMEDEEGAQAWILHRDIMTPGNVLEAYYRKALDRGVRFVRFAQEAPPQILGDGRVEAVEVRDSITGETREIPADLVVLSTPLVAGNDAETLGRLFGLQRDRYGFFREVYPMHPVETRIDGVYICGSARWPVSSEQAMLQGEAAAMKAASLVARKRIRASELSRLPGPKFGHARVNENTCSGCGNCAAACPFEAVRLQRRNGTGPFRMVSRVNKVRCKACGNCLSACPNGTIEMPERNTKVLYGMVGKAFS